MKFWFLKLHRWLALAFALPLVVVIATGLILSVEPWLVTRAVQPGALTAEQVEALLKRHDPRGQARMLAYRSYDQTLALRVGRGGGTVIDTRTGDAQAAPSALSELLGTSRRLHEKLLLDAGWLVIAATAAMLAVVVLGVLMGWPRFANTAAGWHKAIAWGLLPFIALSPLTGLLMAAGVTFMPAPEVGAEQKAPLPLVEAVRRLGQERDLSTLIWLRARGGRMLARLVENGEYRIYAVTREAIAPMPRNWPRLWHEGNFAGAWSAAMNVVVSLAMMALLATGVWVWAKRRMRRRGRRLQAQPAT